MHADSPERQDEIQQAAVSALPEAAAGELEGEVREFVRRDLSFRQRLRPLPAANAGADHLIELIHRVSNATAEEIEGVITELQSTRDALRSEGEHLQREISNYARMSQTARSLTTVIVEGLRQFPPPAARTPYETD
ncbi:MAG: hypothetical protein ACLPKB_12515 [Xanthobacteraceae bacterium]